MTREPRNIIDWLPSSLRSHDSTYHSIVEHPSVHFLFLSDTTDLSCLNWHFTQHIFIHYVQSEDSTPLTSHSTHTYLFLFTISRQTPHRLIITLWKFFSNPTTKAISRDHNPFHLLPRSHGRQSYHSIRSHFDFFCDHTIQGLS